MEYWSGGNFTPFTPALQHSNPPRKKFPCVDHLVLKVKDLERSRKFFTEILGLPQVGENDRGMLFFSTDVVDNHHMLALREAKPGVAMPEPEQIGMEHVSFELGTFAEL